MKAQTSEIVRFANPDFDFVFFDNRTKMRPSLNMTQLTQGRVQNRKYRGVQCFKIKKKMSSKRRLK